MLDIPCVVFAGGKSSRMGEDKSLLPFAAFPTLTEYQYTRLSKYFSKVYISTKNPSKFDFKANFIEDIEGEYAPSLGFVSAFRKLQCERIFVISVDTPFISLEVITKLIDEDTRLYEATVASLYNKTQPMCGIYHSSLLSKFEEMIETNQHKLGLLLKNAKTNYVRFDNEKTFLNLNHPHEYQEALTILSK